jgi:hypothetical protein
VSERRTVSVKDIESLLVCLPGIQKARVVVNDWGAIEEIHILTGLGRNPKQIVRDVQSALKAQWDITVDRRKVSVAQVQAGLPEATSRLRYSGLEVKTDARTGKSEIIVTLDRAGEGSTPSYVGKAIADSTEIATLLGVARATCLAGNLTLEPPNAFFVDDVTITTVGQYQAVAVLIDLLTPRRNQEQMVGCALAKRDIREACVRATLDAMNRRIEVLPQKGAIKADAAQSLGPAGGQAIQPVPAGMQPGLTAPASAQPGQPAAPAAPPTAFGPAQARAGPAVTPANKPALPMSDEGEKDEEDVPDLPSPDPKTRKSPSGKS